MGATKGNTGVAETTFLPHSLVLLLDVIMSHHLLTLYSPGCV